MINKAIPDGYAVLDSMANLARLTRIDTQQQIVICDLIFATYDGEEIISEHLLDFDRYFWYDGDKKNLPFADLTNEEIEELQNPIIELIEE